MNLHSVLQAHDPKLSLRKEQERESKTHTKPPSHPMKSRIFSTCEVGVAQEATATSVSTSASVGREWRGTDIIAKNEGETVECLLLARHRGSF